LVQGPPTSGPWPFLDYDPPMPHFRLPAIAPGVKAFLWALALGVYIFFFLRATSLLDRPTDFILSALAFCLIFLYVRIFGSDLPV
jgi:hypothetical protein